MSEEITSVTDIPKNIKCFICLSPNTIENFNFCRTCHNGECRDCYDQTTICSFCRGPKQSESPLSNYINCHNCSEDILNNNDNDICFLKTGDRYYCQGCAKYCTNCSTVKLLNDYLTNGLPNTFENHILSAEYKLGRQFKPILNRTSELRDPMCKSCVTLHIEAQTRMHYVRLRALVNQAVIIKQSILGQEALKLYGNNKCELCNRYTILLSNERLEFNKTKINYVRSKANLEPISLDSIINCCLLCITSFFVLLGDSNQVQ